MRLIFALDLSLSSSASKCGRRGAEPIDVLRRLVAASEVCGWMDGDECKKRPCFPNRHPLFQSRSSDACGENRFWPLRFLLVLHTPALHVIMVKWKMQLSLWRWTKVVVGLFICTLEIKLGKKVIY
jgi:hypothetical protein